MSGETPILDASLNMMVCVGVAELLARRGWLERFGAQWLLSVILALFKECVQLAIDSLAILVHLSAQHAWRDVQPQCQETSGVFGLANIDL